MKKQPLKVAVIYNEANPELYHKKTELELNNLNFIPFFEVDDLTPMEEYDILAKKLRNAGLDAYTLNINDSILPIIKSVQEKKPDVIFNFVEIFGEYARLEMNIAGLYELLEVAYTGAPPYALANCQSKIFAKRLLKGYGINTPNFIIIKEVQKNYKHNLRYPLIVKPAFEDASVGIENDSIVNNYKELNKRVEYSIKYYNQPALVEEFIEGRELNVAIFGDENPVALPISEIDFSEMPSHLRNIVSYQAKWDPTHEAYHKTIPHCPAKLPKKIENKAKEIAISAFKLMGCRDYARIDMRLSKSNELFVLEVNPNPDLTEGAGFMRSAEAAGYSYTRALKKIVELAYLRNLKIKKSH